MVKVQGFLQGVTDKGCKPGICNLQEVIAFQLLKQVGERENAQRSARVNLAAGSCHLFVGFAF